CASSLNYGSSVVTHGCVRSDSRGSRRAPTLPPRVDRTGEASVKKQINVVGAVIVKDGEILCAQRGDGGSLAGMWEFPGGKIEPGETPQGALQREIDEELRCEVRVGEHVETTAYDYDFGVVTLTT